MAEQGPMVSRVLATIESRDWEALELLLHHDVHWTTAAEEDLRGPDEVIARLAADPPPAPPAWHELRGSQVYRWIDTPG